MIGAGTSHGGRTRPTDGPCATLDGRRPGPGRTPVPRRRAGASRCPHTPGVVHAPGRAVPARVPGGPRGRAASSSAIADPSWRPRSPCSRSAATASTPPSCSPTSWCRSHAIGFGVDIGAGPGPGGRPSRSARPADLDRLRPLEPEADVPYVPETVRLLRRRARPGPADRLRRRAVHRGQLPGRGRARRATFAQVKALMHTEPAPVGRAGRPAGRHGDRLPAGPGRRRGLGRAALRQLGRLPLAGRVRALRPAGHRAGCWPGSPTSGVPTILFGVGTGELLAPDGHGRGRRRRRRLAGAARRGPAAGRAGAGGAGQPRPGHLPGPLGGGRRPRPAQVLAAGRQRSRATSSTWATACCPRPTRASWPRWSTWSTPRGGRVVASRECGGRGRGPGDGPRHAGHGPRRSSPSTPASAGDGRPPPEQLADLRRRYEAIGGTSPLAARTGRPGGRAGRPPRARPTRAATRSRFGAKHTEPSIEDGGGRAGGRRGPSVVGLVLTPHRSASGSGEYLDGPRRPPAAGRPPFVARAPSGTTRRASPSCWPGGSVAAPGRPARTGGGPVASSSSPPTRCRRGSWPTGDPYPEQLAESAGGWSPPRPGSGLGDVAGGLAERRPDPRALARARPPRRPRDAGRPRGRRRGGLPDRVRGRPPRGPLRPRRRGPAGGRGGRAGLRPHRLAQRRPGVPRRAGRRGPRGRRRPAALTGGRAPPTRRTVAVVGGGHRRAGRGLGADRRRRRARARTPRGGGARGGERLGGKLRTDDVRRPAGRRRARRLPGPAARGGSRCAGRSAWATSCEPIGVIGGGGVGPGPPADPARRAGPRRADPVLAGGPLGHPRFPAARSRLLRRRWRPPGPTSGGRSGDRAIGPLVARKLGPPGGRRAWSTRWSAASTPARSPT